MIKSYLRSTFSLFFVLAFIFIPFFSDGINYQYKITKFVFSKPIIFIQDHFFKQSIKNIDFSSDTTSLNILFILLLLTSAIIAMMLSLSKIRSIRFTAISQTLSSYYIAFILLKYGIDKVFKKQFYLPEPNILYSQFGDLTKDTLYWSVMGLSNSYSIFTGIIEVLIAILILIKRTRIFGLCLSIAALANIVLINFSFDISVKTFSVFLLLVSFFALSSDINTICNFFCGKQGIKLKNSFSGAIFKTFRLKRLKQTLILGIIGYILYPYLSSGYLNDDHSERPLLHGAYEVEGFVINQDTLDNNNFPIKKIFIHRNNYIIFQQKDGKMIDYYFEINPIIKQLTLQDYKKNHFTVKYDYVEKTGVLDLKFTNEKKWEIKSKALDWKALPALQDGIHLTIDEIR